MFAVHGGFPLVLCPLFWMTWITVSCTSSLRPSENVLPLVLFFVLSEEISVYLWFVCDCFPQIFSLGYFVNLDSSMLVSVECTFNRVCVLFRFLCIAYLLNCYHFRCFSVWCCLFCNCLEYFSSFLCAVFWSFLRFSLLCVAFHAVCWDWFLVRVLRQSLLVFCTFRLLPVFPSCSRCHLSSFSTASLPNLLSRVEGAFVWCCACEFSIVVGGLHCLPHSRVYPVVLFICDFIFLL